MDWIERLLKTYERTRGFGHTKVATKIAKEEGALYVVMTHNMSTVLRGFHKSYIVTIHDLPERAMGLQAPLVLDNHVVICLLNDAHKRGQRVRVLEGGLESTRALNRQLQFQVDRLERQKERLDRELKATWDYKLRDRWWRVKADVMDFIRLLKGG